MDQWEQENILEARKWLMNQSIFSKYEIFREDFILNLHKRMFRHVWKWAGNFRKSNKNIGVEHYQIHLQLHQILDDAKFWLENNSYNSTDLAIIFHHRLVKIHLFSNGNGRHARLMADAAIAKYDGQVLSWGSNSDLTKPGEIRKRYISGLREADLGNYQPILEFARS